MDVANVYSEPRNYAYEYRVTSYGVIMHLIQFYQYVGL